MRLLARELIRYLGITVQLFAVDWAVELHDVRQVELDALLDDGLDHVNVDIHLRVGEVDRVRPCTGGAPTRVEIERGQILHDLVQCPLLELVFLAQSNQLVSAEFADARPLRYVIALDILQTVHRVVVHSFCLFKTTLQKPESAILRETYLIVVLVANRGEMLRTCTSHTPNVFHLAEIALVDSVHLLHAVVSDALHLAIVVLAQPLQLLALVLLHRLEQVPQLLGSRRQLLPAAVAPLPPAEPAISFLTVNRSEIEFFEYYLSIR